MGFLAPLPTFPGRQALGVDGASAGPARLPNKCRRRRYARHAPGCFEAIVARGLGTKTTVKVSV